MIKDVFVTGYTDFITDDFLANAFPNCRVVITGGTQVKNSNKNRILVYNGELTEDLARRLFRMYEFDEVVYFSQTTAPFTSLGGNELELLGLVLDLCTRDTRVLYITGPEYPQDHHMAVIQQSIREMCKKSADILDGVNVIVSPWIYDLHAKQPTLWELFAGGTHTVEYAPDQDVSFIASEDMALLIFRMFNDWESSLEPYYIPNIFIGSIRKLTSIILAESQGDEINYKYKDKHDIEFVDIKSKRLRSRFIWFPVYSIFEDLAEMIRYYREQSETKTFSVLDFFKTKKYIVLAAELLVGALITELLLKLCGIAVQFELIDFRLLYIVVMGIMYNMRVGMIAAGIESLSLILAYFSTGTDWLTLFYEPTNWLAFVAYFTVGALCGYIRNKDMEQLKFSRDETKSVTDRYNYLMAMNEDILQEKLEYKQQIIGSRDSFGKIFDITRQLDSTHPKYLLGQAVEIIERVMRNSSVAIYFCNMGSVYGRLSVSSRGCDLPFSLPMQQYYTRLEDVNEGEAWVNRDLEDGLPRYMFAIRKEGKINMIILLNNAEHNQMTTYYENLFRVLCGLISSSLTRAADYQEAVNAKRRVEGTFNVLAETYFIEELQYALDAYEKNVATHLLLEIKSKDLSPAQAEERILKCIRNTDIIGCANGKIYAMLTQAHPADLKFIGPRFEKVELEYELITTDLQRELLESKVS